MANHPSNQQLAQTFSNVAAVYEILNENFFKIRAYKNAAEAIEHSNEEIKDIWERGALVKVPGIGASIAQHIDEIFRTGKCDYVAKVLEQVPVTAFKLLELPGIGPKTAGRLAYELNLTDPKTLFDELKKAAANNQIANLEGFGKKSQDEIIESISRFKRASKQEKRILLGNALLVADDFVTYMQQNKSVDVIEGLGSLRRKKATLGDLDFAVVTDNPKDVVLHFTTWSQAQKILAAGENTARIIHVSGIQIDIKTTSKDKYGSLLQHFTGSKEHNVALREYAQKNNLSLSEKGIKNKSTDKTTKYSSEKDFYKALNMDWIPPELRENNGEIELALVNKLPKLVKLSDIKGDLHIHSDFPIQPSHDLGRDSMEDVVEQAEKLNYTYIAFSEHNPKKTLSNEEKLKLVVEKKGKIDKLKTNLVVFNSLEVDILPDGSLPLDSKTLAELDLVIASLHSSFRQSKEDMTKRILRGLSHPKAKVMGHPTGRLIQEREGVDADWHKIFTFCAENNKALEINASDKRLDLPEDLAREAKEYGVMFALGTDAHSKAGLTNMSFGISVARRAGLEACDIINTWSLIKFKKWVYDIR